MPDIKFLKPHPERLVRDPVTGRKLNPAGEFISLADPRRAVYYRRRIKDQDVTEGRPQMPKKAAPAADAKED